MDPSLEISALKLLMLVAYEYKHLNKIESIELVKKYLDQFSKEEKMSKSVINKEIKNLITDVSINGIDNLSIFEDNVKLVLESKPNLFDTFKELLSSKYNKSTHDAKIRELKDEFVKKQLINKMEMSKVRLMNKSTSLEKTVHELKEYLNLLEIKKIFKDSNVIDEINFDSDDDINTAAKKANELSSDSTVFKTGFKSLNDMCMGGLRRGELVTILALPHRYKSGLTKSLFLQIARLNKPESKDGKKPMLVFISLEEDIRVIVLFFYTYLKLLKENVLINIRKDTLDPIDVKETIRKYMREESNFSLRIMKLDPTNTTVEKIMEKIDIYNNNGYDVQGLFIDYLSQISKKGLEHDGVSGNNVKELFKKMRSECNSRNVLLVTPHQVSPDGKRLLRSGIPGIEYTRVLVGKGYYDGASKLDQEIDLELYVHKCYLNKKPIITISRGKHRLPGSEEPEENVIMYSFPKYGVPIVEDTDDRSLEIDNNSVNDDFEI